MSLLTQHSSTNIFIRVERRLEGSKMELTYFDDRFGISTIKHFEISLRILVLLLELENHPSEIDTY